MLHNPSMASSVSFHVTDGCFRSHSFEVVNFLFSALLLAFGPCIEKDIISLL